MSVSINLFLAALCCLIYHVSLIVIVNFISWLEAQSYSGFNNQCYQSDTSPKYEPFLVVNFVLAVGCFWLLQTLRIKDYEMKHRVVRYLKYPYTLCKNLLTGNLGNTASVRYCLP